MRRPRAFALREDGAHPLRGDHRFVVGCTHHAAPRGDRLFDEGLGGHRDGRLAGDVLAEGLGEPPVVTVRAPEIAAVHPERERLRARLDVVDGVRLDGAHVAARDVAEGNEDLAVPPLADAARAGATVGEDAAMRAGRATEEASFALLQLAVAGYGERREIEAQLGGLPRPERGGREEIVVLVLHGRLL